MTAPTGGPDERAAPGPGDDQPLFHAALPDDWAAAFQTGEYVTSTRGATLAEVGFVHLAARDQIEGVANRFYADLDQLVLLTVDPERVPAEIRWEPPTPDAEERFPHAYGPLPIASVVSTTFWIRPAGAAWALPD